MMRRLVLLFDPTDWWGNARAAQGNRLSPGPSDGGSRKSEKAKPFVVAEQGRFAVGGTVLPNGGTFDLIGLALNLNNLKVADLLSRYLKEKALDRH